MNLRSATEHDVPAMVELQQAGFRVALIPLLPDDFELTDPVAWRARLAEALATDGVWAMVVDGVEGLAGLVVYGLNRDAEPAPGAGELRALFVQPGHWCQGLGRALVEQACAHLQELGYSAVTLWSLRDNDRANAFYERLGFERDGATEVHPSLGAPVVRYTSPLRHYTF